MDKNNTRQRGYRGEDIAAQYLEEHGFRIVARNYYYDRCETDIIAEDGKYLLFAEVKTRVYGGRSPLSQRRPCLAVTEAKASNMRRSAAGFLHEHSEMTKVLFPRFEVIEVMIADGVADVRRVHMIE